MKKIIQAAIVAGAVATSIVQATPAFAVKAPTDFDNMCAGYGCPQPLFETIYDPNPTQNGKKWSNVVY